MAEGDLVKTVMVFLKLLGVKVTEKTLTTVLTNHPDYPSLSAISNALRKWQVDSLAIEVEPKQLTDIPTPFIVHNEDEGGFFVVVRAVTDSRVEWLHPNKGWQQDSLNTFTKRRSKISLIAEPGPEAGEINYEVNRRREVWSHWKKYFLLTGCLFIAVSSLTVFSTSWYLLGWLIIKLAGIVICGLLITASLNKMNPFVKQLCHVTKLTDCYSVITSPVATIGGLVS